jgi:outer membrane receptor protein involved in Fe transport
MAISFGRSRFVVVVVSAAVAIATLLIGALQEGKVATAETLLVSHGYATLGLSAEQTAALEYATVSSLRDNDLIDNAQSQALEQTCVAEAACHCNAARKRGAAYAVYGSAGLIADTWSVEINLLETHSCRVVNTVLIEDSFADRDIGPQMRKAITRLITPVSEIDETATKVERPADEVPAVVTGFSNSELRDLHLRRLEDVLPLVAGFEAPEANWGTTVLNQGFGNTLLFVADGIPIINGHSNFRTLERDFRTSMGSLDKIEFARGPGSVLWGANAFLGVVNLRSEVGTRREVELEGGLSAGSLNSQEACNCGYQRQRRAMGQRRNYPARRGYVFRCVDESPNRQQRNTWISEPYQQHQL